MPDPHGDLEQKRQESLKKIRRLHSQSNRGIWHLCLFLAVSLAARWNFSFLPSLPDNVRTFLGAAPPSSWISVALVVYSFSAIVLALARMMSGEGTFDGLSHVGYLTAFYMFYYFAGSLPDNFWAVFAAGLTILALVAYGLWTHTSELITEELERLQRIERRADTLRERS